MVVLTIAFSGTYAILAAKEEEFAKGFEISLTSSLGEDAERVLTEELVELTDGVFEGVDTEEGCREIIADLVSEYPKLFRANPAVRVISE